MPALLIKNIPPEIHERLKLEASRHHRSMNKEALFLLEQGLGAGASPSLRDVKPVSTRKRIDDIWIAKAIRWGRL